MCYLQKIPKIERSLFITQTNKIEIKKVISTLSNKNSSGIDTISNNLLKKFSEALLTPLKILFNRSFMGVFPKCLKMAEVIPPYKCKETDLLTNYRPISLLITEFKVLEKLFHKRLYSFLQKEKILYELQHGFGSNRPTDQAITELVGNILNETENDKLTLCVYPDLSKAFDTIDHDILLKKFEHYGIGGVALDWMTSYIKGWKMKIKSTIRDQGDFTIGTSTPHGSCLGPLIFIIFCNDISKICETCKAIIFADDTSIYYSHKNIFKLYEKV